MTSAEIPSALERLSAGFRRLKGIGDEGKGPSGEIGFDEWDWEVGVGLYGEYRAGRGPPGIGRRWSGSRAGTTGRSPGACRRRQVNSTAPMLTLALLAEQLAAARLGAISSHDWAAWLQRKCRRPRRAAFSIWSRSATTRASSGTTPCSWPCSSWRSRAGFATASDWVEEAHYQFLTHIRFLGDPATGLFFHGWTFIGRHHFAHALWARGNAWITMAIPELFRIAPPSGATARYLRAVYATQVAALSKLQNADGMFHTLLVDPTSPVEASGTAGIAYGILAGVREGLIGAEHLATVRKSLAAILSRIDGNGFLGDVSDGTAMGPDLDFYRRIPNLPTPYGQALASLFLLEARRALTEPGTEARSRAL